MKYPEQEFNGKIYRLYPGENYYSRGARRLHRIVWENFNGPIPKGKHIHHKDGDKSNNEISNLEMVAPGWHVRHHMTPERVKKQREWAKKIRPLTLKWHRSKEGRVWHKEHGKKVWHGMPFSKRNCNLCGKEYKTKFPNRSQYCHQNCKMRARRRRTAHVHVPTL